MLLVVLALVAVAGSAQAQQTRLSALRSGARQLMTLARAQGQHKQAMRNAREVIQRNQVSQAELHRAYSGGDWAALASMLGRKHTAARYEAKLAQAGLGLRQTRAASAKSKWTMASQVAPRLLRGLIRRWKRAEKSAAQQANLAQQRVDTMDPVPAYSDLFAAGELKRLRATLGPAPKTPVRPDAPGLRPRTDPAQHVAWAKQRAHRLADNGDLQGSVASMLSDLRSYGPTSPMAQFGTIGLPRELTPAAVHLFIEGFN